jgi:hypothetical protein
MSDNQPPTAGNQVMNAVKFIADVSILPGSSQIVEGSVGPGLLYGAAGFAAMAIGGPLLWLGVGLDSYSMSASGKHLWELLPSYPYTRGATAEPVQTSKY